MLRADSDGSDFPILIRFCRFFSPPLSLRQLLLQIWSNKYISWLPLLLPKTSASRLFSSSLYLSLSLLRREQRRRRLAVRRGRLHAAWGRRHVFPSTLAPWDLSPLWHWPRVCLTVGSHPDWPTTGMADALAWWPSGIPFPSLTPARARANVVLSLSLSKR